MTKIRRRVAYAIRKYSSTKAEGEEGVLEIEFFETGAIRIITKSLESGNKREMFLSKQTALLIMQELKFDYDNQAKF